MRDVIHNAVQRVTARARRGAARALFVVLAGMLSLAIGGAAAAQTSDDPAPGDASSPNILIGDPGAATDAIEQAKRDGATIVVLPPGRVGLDDYRQLVGDGNPVEQYAELAGVDDSMLDRTQTRVADFRASLLAKLQAAPTTFSEIAATLAGASITGEASYFAWVAVVIGVGLMLGYFVEKFVYAQHVIGPWFAAQQKARPVGYVEKLPILALRVILTASGVVVSAGVAIMTGLIFYEPHEPTQKTAIVVIATFVAIRMVEAIWRMVLAPYLPNYRIPIMSDADAKRLFNWLSVVAALGIASLSFCLWMENLGLSTDIHALITSILTLVTVLLNIAMIRVNHASITNAILGGRAENEASMFARAAARVWAPLASAYFIVAWAEMTYRLIVDLPLGVPLIAGAYAILLVVLIVYAGVSYLIEWVFRRRRMIRALNERAKDPIDEAEEITVAVAPLGDDDAVALAPEPADVARDFYRMRTMEDLARRVASVLAVVAGLWSVLWIWDGETVMADGIVLSQLFDIGVTAFLGYIAYHAVRIGIDQKIQEEGGAEVMVSPGDEGGGDAAASRLATLLPLFRNLLLVTISIVTILFVLLSTGVNVTPIFAGAGVVGLAIGFGAQTLVRDIFSGMFFLIDDAFRKGEYIDLGTVKGTVEKISIRSFQLRHHLGYLHTVPFGEVQYLTNYSRDWVMMKLPLRLTYDTDVERVRKLIKDLGKRLLQDPELGEKFLQPLKSQGVYEMEESAMILRVKFMTRPGEQWVIRKRIYAEIRELFEREGIKFAHREVTVHVAGDTPEQGLTAKQKEAITGAVRPVLEEPTDGRAMALQDDR